MSEKKPNNMVWINKISEKQISAGVDGKYGPSVRIPCGDGKFGQAFIAAKTPATTKDGDVIEGKFNVALAERAKVLFKSEEDAKAVAETFGDKCSYDEKNPRAFVVDSAALKERVNTERINYAKSHAGAERRVPETPTAGETEPQAEEQAEV